MANNIEKQLKEISERLEQGVKEIFTSERYTEYLNTMSKFHNYSFNNTLLLTMQKPEATLVAGYQAWQKKFNRHVKRGEKGIQIIAPAPIREKQEIEKIDPVTKEPVIGDDGQPETEIVEMVIPRFRVTTVFDVSQTEGEPIADLEVPEMQAIAKAHGVHPALIALKWAHQRGEISIPFSVHNYVSNLKCVTEDPLTEEEMARIGTLERGNRLVKGQVFLWEGAKDWHDLWDEDGFIIK